MDATALDYRFDFDWMGNHQSERVGVYGSGTANADADSTQI